MNCPAESDPQFIDTSTRDFSVRETSPATNAGVEHSIFATFENRYGIDIRQDRNGLARPQQGAWDIGALEYANAVLDIITNSLATGQAGSAVSYPIIATGGSAPYAWTISTGTLPDGLSLNSVTGVIMGTPTAAGNFTFTLRVQDSVTAADTQQFSLVIDAEAVPDDVIAPAITLLGDNPQTITVNSIYTDPGATANDNIDGDISANIVVVSTVDVSTEGTYTVTYNVSDAAGNRAIEITRTVNVIAEVVAGNPTNSSGGGGSLGLRALAWMLGLQKMTMLIRQFFTGKNNAVSTIPIGH